MYVQFIEAHFTFRMSRFFRTSVNNLIYAHTKSVAFPLPIFMKLTNTQQHNVQIYTRFHKLVQEMCGVWIFTSFSKVLLSMCLILYRADKNV